MGLIGGMARTAVVAGTATAVSNRVSRRQANRWASSDQAQYDQQYEQQQQQYAAPPQQYAPPPQQYAPPPQQYAPPPAPAPAPAASDTDDTLDQLSKLCQLRAQGILTQEEFDAQKAKILAG